MPRRNPTPQLDPNASPEALAAAWAKMTKRQRLALITQMQAPAKSSASRQAEVEGQRIATARQV